MTPDYPATAEEMVQQYGGYPVACANRALTLLPFSEGALERADLVQAGMLGLMEAYRAYDPDREASFRTFAWIACRNAIWRTVRQMYTRRGARGERIVYERKEATSLDALLPHDLIALSVDPAAQAMEPDARAAVVEAVRALEPTSRWIVLSQSLDGQTFHALGQELNLSRQRVQQIHACACRQLRKQLAVLLGRMA